MSEHKMTAQKIVAKDLQPRDVVLHEGNWYTVTALTHYPIVRTVRVAVNRLIGTPASFVLHDTATPWVIPAEEAVPAEEVVKPDQSAGGRVPYPRGI